MKWRAKLEFPGAALQARPVTQAFIPGAGLGKRLRPLTGFLPKPLVPLFHWPLAEWAVEACARAGIRRFSVNTHHLPEAWNGFGGGRDITLFHEPVLLETGGGVKNIAPWLEDGPLLVHNGDIFSSLPLEALMAAHRASGRAVTLALRSDVPAKHIAVDGAGGVVDIRGMLGKAEGTLGFSGIYCAGPELLELIPPDEPISVIPAFLELAKSGGLGGITLDDGVWLDLGDRESYLRAHRELALGPAIHPLARIAPDADVAGSVVGPGAVVEAGAVVKNSVIWPGGRVAAGADLADCIVCSGNRVAGCHRSQDL